MKAKRNTHTEFAEGRGYSREDWDEVSDNPEFTSDDLTHAKPFAEVFPDLAEGLRRMRGRPPVSSPREAVTLRLDPGTLRKFKATGKNWRAKMSEVLDKATVER